MAREVLIGDILKRIKRPVKLVDDQDYKLITIRLNHKGVVLRETKKGAEIKSGMYEVREGDFILSGIDARNGAFGIVPSELDGAVVTNDFWYFEIDESVISKQLFLELTATSWFDEICKLGSDGTTQRIRLQKDKFFNQSILLPEEDKQDQLLYKLLSNKEKQTELAAEITNQKQLLSQLKQSILQEAIQGKLTADWRAQNHDVEPASELLKRIKAEKEKLLKEKKIKKEKPLLPITADEIHFELPEGWIRCRLGDLGQINPKNSCPDNIEVGFIPMALISEEFGVHPSFEVRLWADIKKGFTHFANNDVVVAKITPCFENSKAAVVHGLPNSLGAGTTELHVFRNYLGDDSLSDFIYVHFKSPEFLRTGESFMTGSSGQKRVPKDYITNRVVCLPPLEEIQVIIQKVKALMDRCRNLEAEIIYGKQHVQLLMQAVLKEAFEPSRSLVLKAKEQEIEEPFTSEI